MTDTPAQRKARERAAKRASGLVPIEVWVPMSGVPAIRKLEVRLQRAGEWEMERQIISRDYADSVSMDASAKFGLISEGCLGVWGDGKTESEAINSAVEELERHPHDDDVMGFVRGKCWVLEVVE